MSPTRHSIRVPSTVGEDGPHEIVFYDWGNPESLRVTVCVHGLSRNARDFDFLAAELASTGRRVLALNMAGRGESAWLVNPMGYNYASYVADCLAVMDNFHLREVEWVGTSMGGIIGMMIASQFPRRIKRLVMNDIGAFLSKEALARIYAYVATMPRSFTDRAQAEGYLRAAFAPWGIADEATWRTLIDNSLITRDGALCYACDPAIAVPLAAATENYTKVEDVNLSAIWANVQIPTFILHGADSDILSTDTIRAMRATNLNTDSISFAGVGHAPALMSENQIRPLLNWLDRTPASIMATSF